MKLLIILASITIFSVIGVGEGFADSDDIFTVIASIDKDVYELGDTITISGHLENFDTYYDDNVHFEVYSPFNKYSYFGILFPNVDGYFVTDIETDSSWRDVGDYTIKLKYGYNIDTLTIKYLGDLGQIQVDETEKPILSVRTVESDYKSGDIIIINGKINTDSEGLPVVIQVFHDNMFVYLAQLELAHDGSFTDTIIADGPLWTESGDYEVRAVYQNQIVKIEFNYTPISSVTIAEEKIDDEKIESIIDELETVVEPIIEEIKIAPFVEKEQEHYIVRYHSEPTYREWFDTNYSEYNTIEKAVGLAREIPEWTDNIFAWYDQSKITKDEIQSAIKYLINEEI